jgi:hypothetical protein
MTNFLIMAMGFAELLELEPMERNLVESKAPYEPVLESFHFLTHSFM